MFAKCLSSACFAVAIGLIGVGVFQATEPWRRPSVENLTFDLAVPADVDAESEHEVTMTIRNANRRPITIYGEYTC